MPRARTVTAAKLTGSTLTGSNLTRSQPTRGRNAMPNDIFDATVARDYDAASADRFRPEVLGPTVDVLAALARADDGSPGDALELAIGTGRVALPLAARGVAVHGIELSEAMVDVLRAKPGGAELPVTVGDMATARLDRAFGLVFLVFNTIQNLLTQDEQVACFANAAAHLRPGGRFVVETGVPGLRRLPPGERFVPFDVSPGHVGFDEYEPARQILTSHHVWLPEGNRFDSQHRYVWPSELDLMARLAGLRLEDRWEDWNRSPFTDESTQHVSVWRKPDAP
jgi:SAM-dependent methyltransferase